MIGAVLVAELLSVGHLDTLWLRALRAAGLFRSGRQWIELLPYEPVSMRGTTLGKPIGQSL